MYFWKFLANFVSMKNSIDFLPERKQRDLHELVRLIRDEVKDVVMVILYGSYARNTYVECDERRDFGVRTFYISDYDLLVVTSNEDVREVGHLLDTVDDKYYKRPDNQVPIQFINDDIEKLNSDLSEGRYFYTSIQKQGIMLYDSGNYKLERPRKLNFQEITQQSQEYFDEKFEKAGYFLDHASFDYEKGRYNLASFDLHQACENYYYAIRLTYTLRNNKQHNLSKLSSSTKRYSEDLATVFPQDTLEEKRLFTLLKSAYVEARYNPYFVVTKEDIDALVPKVELLRDITKQI